MPQFFTKPVIKILAVAVIAVAFIVYVRTAAHMSPPNEQNRVTSIVGGYSIVRPDDFEGKLTYGSKDRKFKDMLEVRPKISKGANEPRIFIGRYRDPPDLEAIRAREEQTGTSFKNYDADVFTGETKREFFWHAVIQHGGEWYELVLWLPRRVNVAKSEWWPYLQTFEAPDVPPATTLPATSMPTTQFQLRFD